MDKIFYLAKVFGSIHTIFGIILALGLIALTTTAIWYFADLKYLDEEDADMFKKFIRGSIIATIISALVCIFVPDKETYLFIAGGKAVEAVAKNENVQETAGKTLNLLNEYIEYKTEEVREKHNHNKED